MVQIIGFGSDTTLGVADDAKGGWLSRLNISTSNLVYNMGVSGDTSRDLRQRLGPELDHRMSDTEKTVVLIESGITDAAYFRHRGDHRISIEEYGTNIEQVLITAREKADQVAFLGLTPVVEAKTTPIHGNDRIYYHHKHVREYEDRLYETCERYSVDFIELYDPFLDKGHGQLLKNGLHPNSKGHKLITKKVQEYLKDTSP